MLTSEPTFFNRNLPLYSIGLKSTLEQFGTIKIIGEATKGEEAISVVEKYNPDVVICDIGLPNKNGIETADEIHKKFPNIKIIMLTSHVNDNEILQSLGIGANAYCLKSITPERFFRVGDHKRTVRQIPEPFP